MSQDFQKSPLSLWRRKFLFTLAGLTWAAGLFAATPALAVCTLPDGIAGEIETFDADNIMRYCNGSNWIDMGVAGDDGAGNADPTWIRTDKTLSSVQKVFAIGNYIYGISNASATFFVIDVTTPAAPVYLSILQEPDILRKASDMVIDGNYAYITTIAGFNLVVIDISDPANPTIAATVNHTYSATVNSPNDIAKSGDLIFLASSGGWGIYVFDVSTPTAPVSGVRFGGGTNNRSVSAAGNYVFHTAGNTLYTTDFTDPAAPVTVNTQGGYSSFAEATSFINGNYLYITAGDANTLYTFDISTPAAPVLADSLTASMNFSGLEVYGSISGNYLYLSAGYALYVIDVSNPANLSLAASVTGASNSLSSGANLTTAGNYAYSFNHSLFITDISDPLNPVYQGIFEPQRDCFGPYNNFFYCVDNERWTSTAKEFAVWDYNDVMAPVKRGTLTITTSSNSVQLLDSSYSDGYFYLLSSGNPRLNIIDVRNPDSPSLVSATNIISTASGGASSESYAEGNYLYVTSGNNFQIADISNKVSPSLVSSINGHLSGSGGFDGLFVSTRHNLAFLGSEPANKLSIIDISAPASPSVKSNMTFARVARFPNLVIKDNVVYLGARAGSSSSNYITSIDISDPSNPVILDEISKASSFTEGLAIYGNYLIAGTNYEVFDISDPSNMTHLYYFSDVPLSQGALTQSGNYAYFSYTQGIHIVDIGTNYGAGIGNTGSTCTAPSGKLGSLHFDFVSYTLRMCNGTRWVKLGADGNGGAGCAGPPTGVAGTFYYDTGTNQYKYCEGDTWVTFN